jgi:hypothetical protein
MEVFAKVVPPYEPGILGVNCLIFLKYLIVGHKDKQAWRITLNRSK